MENWVKNIEEKRQLIVLFPLNRGGYRHWRKIIQKRVFFSVQMFARENRAAIFAIPFEKVGKRIVH